MVKELKVGLVGKVVTVYKMLPKFLLDKGNKSLKISPSSLT